MKRTGYLLGMGLMLVAILWFAAAENWAAVFAAASAFFAWTHAYNLRFPFNASEAAARFVELGSQWGVTVNVTKNKKEE